MSDAELKRQTHTRFHSDPKGLNDHGSERLFHLAAYGLLPQKVNAKSFQGGLKGRRNEMIKRLRDKVYIHPIRVPTILDALLVVETPCDMLIVSPDVSDEVVAEDVEVFLQAKPARREQVDDVMPFHDIDLSRAGSISYYKRDRRSLLGV